MLKATETFFRDAPGANIGGCHVNNAKLKNKYNEMHKKGPSAWFDDGENEREGIIMAGGNWAGVKVLEIGCGEGDLCVIMDGQGASVMGIDYSETAIDKATSKWPGMKFRVSHYRAIKWRGQRVVMMGVLEHLDNPFKELEWIMHNMVEDGGDCIVSCPCFLNPRGIVWMTLHLLGAVMSKTDLHFINPWDMEKFCKGRYELEMSSIDYPWGYGEKMVRDLEKRIPLALQDGKLKPIQPKDLESFLAWLEFCGAYIINSSMNGAVGIYRISK